MRPETLQSLAHAFPEYFSLDAIDLLNLEIPMTEPDPSPEAQAAANADTQTVATVGSEPPAVGTQPDTTDKAPAPQPTEPLEYWPELAEGVIYRDEHGTEHAALVTRVVDTQSVHLVVFPDEGHHRHVTASAVTPSSKAAGWYPNDA